MPDAYSIYDGRFTQFGYLESAADALYLAVGPVPPQKVWQIRTGSYNPNVTETRTIVFSIIPQGSSDYVTFSRYATVALGTSVRLPMFQEGNEIKLYPGEQLRITRDAATAGSTMIVRWLYYEVDLPPYDYIDPQMLRAKSIVRGEAARTIGGGVSGGVARGIGSIGTGSGRGRGSGTPI